MIHTIIYHGKFALLNWDRLHAQRDHLDDFQYVDQEGHLRPLDPPSPKVDGLVFGFMEKPGLDLDHRYFAVRVEDVVLDHEVQLVACLHTDRKGHGPKPTQFGDESARRLLEDMMEENPEQRALLTELRRRTFGHA